MKFFFSKSFVIDLKPAIPAESIAKEKYIVSRNIFIFKNTTGSHI